MGLGGDGALNHSAGRTGGKARFPGKSEGLPTQHSLRGHGSCKGQGGTGGTEMASSKGPSSGLAEFLKASCFLSVLPTALLCARGGIL